MAYRKLFPERATTPRGVVYLIHFAQPFGECRHYIGFARSLSDRLREHVNGTAKSSVLMRLVYDAGIQWELARVWENASTRDEYRLKNWGGAARSLCPICMDARKRANPENPTTKALARLTALLPPGYTVTCQPRRVKLLTKRQWRLHGPDGTIVASVARSRDLERKIRKLEWAEVPITLDPNRTLDLPSDYYEMGYLDVRKP